MTIRPSAHEQEGRGREEPPILLVSYSRATLLQAAQKIAGGMENVVGILACGFPSVCDSWSFYSTIIVSLLYVHKYPCWVHFANSREREPTSPQGLRGIVKRTRHKAQGTWIISKASKDFWLRADSFLVMTSRTGTSRQVSPAVERLISCKRVIGTNDSRNSNLPGISVLKHGLSVLWALAEKAGIC